jgi:DNA processing protein
VNASPLGAGAPQQAALVALLRRTGLDAPGIADAVERDGAEATLAAALGAGTTLLPEDPAPAIAEARRDIERWRADGLRLLTVLDDAYPVNLRLVHDRPALLFVAGDPALVAARTALAIVGTRHPAPAGTDAASEFAGAFAAAGHTVVSGLAAGIDSAAHRAAVTTGGRTVAVIGTGHDHAYPPQNAALQRELAAGHAVVSPFWPATEPAAPNFRRRNGVASGLSLGSVIVQAGPRSGTRVQARLALAHGRPVFLVRGAGLLDQAWAVEFAARPGVHIVDEPAEVLAHVAAPHAGPALSPPA